MAIYRVASNFPTAYVRVASQTYVLQHILTLNFITNICSYVKESTILIIVSHLVFFTAQLSMFTALFLDLLLKLPHPNFSSY